MTHNLKWRLVAIFNSGNVQNNIRNEFPVHKLLKIDSLHIFPCSLVQKLMTIYNPIWRPAAISDLVHFPWSDWLWLVGCDYLVIKGVKLTGKLLCDFFHVELYIVWAGKLIKTKDLIKEGLRSVHFKYKLGTSRRLLMSGRDLITSSSIINICCKFTIVQQSKA